MYLPFRVNVSTKNAFRDSEGIVIYKIITLRTSKTQCQVRARVSPRCLVKPQIMAPMQPLFCQKTGTVRYIVLGKHIKLQDMTEIPFFPVNIARDSVELRSCSVGRSLDTGICMI